MVSADNWYFIVAIVGVIVWGVRQEGRITVAEKATTDLKELIGSKLDDLSRRLGRIESALNGTLKGH